MIRVRSWSHQDEVERLYEQNAPGARPLFPPSSRAGDAAALSSSGPGAGLDDRSVVDTRFLVATGWLPVSKLEEL